MHTKHVYIQKRSYLKSNFESGQNTYNKTLFQTKEFCLHTWETNLNSEEA